MKLDDAQINAAITLLRLHGYSVRQAEAFAPESQKQFLARLGISAKHFHCRRQESGCPAFELSAGPTGRMIEMRSNPDFDAWMNSRRCGRPTSVKPGVQMRVLRAIYKLWCVERVFPTVPLVLEWAGIERTSLVPRLAALRRSMIAHLHAHSLRPSSMIPRIEFPAQWRRFTKL